MAVTRCLRKVGGLSLAHRSLDLVLGFTFCNMSTPLLGSLKSDYLFNYDVLELGRDDKIERWTTEDLYEHMMN